MKTTDDILKIKAVVLYILERFPQGIDYIHLFKVMYFAQEEHLATYGMPLIDDSFLTRKHGPVPALTYKAVRCAEGKAVATSDDLADFVASLRVATNGRHQVVTAAPDAHCDLDELSTSSLQVLDRWIDRCKDVNSFDLSSLSHDQAWQQARRQAELTGEDVKITLYDMAKAAGASPAMLQVVRDRHLTRKALAWT